MKVLLVDDSATQRLILKSLIKAIAPEVEVIEVSDGTQALESLQNDNFQIVFSDINMEPMSGTKLFEKSLQSDQCPSFVFITSHLTDSVKENVLEMGAKGFITKPITKEKVEPILVELLKG